MQGITFQPSPFHEDISHNTAYPTITNFRNRHKQICLILSHLQKNNLWFCKFFLSCDSKKNFSVKIQIFCTMLYITQCNYITENTIILTAHLDVFGAKFSSICRHRVQTSSLMLDSTATIISLIHGIQEERVAF
jgi:hypothetical protein